MLQNVVLDQEVDTPRVDVEEDTIAIPDEGQRPADGSLRRNVKDNRAEMSAAHASVRNPHHVPHPPREKSLWDWEHAPFRHPRAPNRAGVPQNENTVFVDVESRIVDPRVHIGKALEDDSTPRVAHQVLACRGALDDRAVRRKVALKDGKAAGGINRIRAGSDYIIADPLSPSEVGSQSLAVHSGLVWVQLVSQFLQKRPQPAGMEASVSPNPVPDGAGRAATARRGG